MNADEVELHLPYRDEMGGNAASSFIHRGVIAAFGDLAGTIAARSRPGRAAQPLAVYLEYLADAPAGSALYARARLVAGNVLVEIYASGTQSRVARATLTERGPLVG